MYLVQGVLALGRILTAVVATHLVHRWMKQVATTGIGRSPHQMPFPHIIGIEPCLWPDTRLLTGQVPRPQVVVRREWEGMSLVGATAAPWLADRRRYDARPEPPGHV